MILKKIRPLISSHLISKKAIELHQLLASQEIVGRSNIHRYRYILWIVMLLVSSIHINLFVCVCSNIFSEILCCFCRRRRCCCCYATHTLFEYFIGIRMFVPNVVYFAVKSPFNDERR